ncbi:Aminotransferase [Caenispirillum salinarum AK4]|uniref:Probable branched-chain-amino-acid aminotransferase n=1 Tax=Caenispirillum salinarum AK4 TaxID=1238182 RepID=K9H158_9PROT|nr:aminotransferase class IV [Caenispirillum salinarum]EKV32000.1 Aminotransferase [Caenispirillum salinarum AK4]
MIVWLNGALLPVDEACIAPSDRGFTLGDGLFETMRAEAGTVLRRDRHLARLRSGAAVLGIPVPLDDAGLAGALTAVLTANDLAQAPAAVLRLELTRGPAPGGLAPPAEPSPTLLVTTRAAPAAAPAPVRLVTARGTRRNEHSPLSRIKHLGYGDMILAHREASGSGADDAIVLNTAGHVAETTISNVFLEVDGAWVTPPVTDGALPGTRRAALLDAGVAAEATVTLAMLARARRAVLSNANGLRPVASIDGRCLSLEEVPAPWR